VTRHFVDRFGGTYSIDGFGGRCDLVEAD